MLRDTLMKHTPQDIPNWQLRKMKFAGGLVLFRVCFFFPVNHY